MSSGVALLLHDNEGLKAKYDEMHSQGPTAWFSDGQNERELILAMGEPWENKGVIEIGCGEGNLVVEMAKRCRAGVWGVDYSEEAIIKAVSNGYPSNVIYRNMNYKDLYEQTDRLVLQGTLEHLDDPFTELKWMIDNLLVPGGDVITSSPGFINPRGFVWMALHMAGALMSKTDLHHLNPWDFEKFCSDNGYCLTYQSTDMAWASSDDMIKDLTQRIPLALRDGKIAYEPERLEDFLRWLGKAGPLIPLDRKWGGASIVYRIET